MSNPRQKRGLRGARNKRQSLRDITGLFWHSRKDGCERRLNTCMHASHLHHFVIDCFMIERDDTVVNMREKTQWFYILLLPPSPWLFTFTVCMYFETLIKYKVIIFF